MTALLLSKKLCAVTDAAERILVASEAVISCDVSETAAIAVAMNSIGTITYSCSLLVVL